MNCSRPAAASQHEETAHFVQSPWIVLDTQKKYFRVDESSVSCSKTLWLNLLKDWVSHWVFKFEQTASWYVLTLFFHILFSLTEWNRILPGAVLFESRQLVDVTFPSYFKSSFHSKVKIWLLAVTFRCGWPCHTVKKWKHHLRLRYFNCHTRNWVFSGTICVSICNKDFSHFVKNETFPPPTLDLSIFCLLSPSPYYLFVSVSVSNLMISSQLCCSWIRKTVKKTKHIIDCFINMF